MKKILTIIIIAGMTIFFACGPSAKEKAEKSRRDSIRIVDSIATVKKCILDSLSKIQVTDYDGNIYNTVVIGDQLWMTTNLKVSHYNNGDPIPYSTGDQWQDVNGGAYSLMTYTNEFVYNGTVVTDSRKVCPKGWHVPTTDELNKLVNFLGGDDKAGNTITKYLNVGNAYSFASNGCLTSGAKWWSASPPHHLGFIGCSAKDYDDTFSRDSRNGFYIRCIKDQ